MTEYNSLEGFMQGFGPLVGMVLVFVILLALWSIVWKGLALWKAARQGDKAWFIVMLVVNTVGILEILYIYVFSKDKSTPAPVAPPSPAPGVPQSTSASL